MILLIDLLSWSSIRIFEIKEKTKDNRMVILKKPYIVCPEEVIKAVELRKM